ncbi:2Fe-2S iron-sulfur cluster-binding protein [Hufsiella ginkgonis]|uniref:2Fe-2S iron-sulfur cluster binding domain-containing protein n=1 Tax=Hufsiella ginkgonis TaxID=2695274 RepID=A0A7K1XXX0_9SPHI|nr:2Fe-2S iron-sulfur cluster-binding protein [Hufsiella ginkgonis]MXV15855.1 2Fe-2S iron-sulfur cluster binding domain-containing protein [Hufsiella ginkgonis]
MITLYVRNETGGREPVEVPTDISLSLMEVLKGYDYPIMATCGGMALCATCHIRVVQGGEQLPPPGDAELDMLDTLPDAGPDSRLACQVRVHENLDGMELCILGNEY